MTIAKVQEKRSKNRESLPYTPYTITYDANGANSSVPSKQNKQAGVSLILLGDTIALTKQEYVFGGWNTQKDGKGTHYDAGSEYRLDQSLTLYAEWYSTINSSADFRKMRNDLSGLFILGNDIDLNSLGGFEPIGTYKHPFTGVFDGNKHSLLGLNMNGNETVGFFAYAKTIRVFDLEFKSPHITGTGSNSNVGKYSFPAGIGVLVGYLYGSNMISNVEIANATVKANKRFAGLLIGNIESTEDAFSIIKDCTVSGSVKGEDDIGGLLGSALRVNIQHCNIRATVTGHAEVGGLAGTLSGNVIESSAAGQVGGTANSVGGLLGAHRWGEIIDSFARASVIGSANNIGGLVGKQLWGSNIKKSHAEGPVTNTGNNTNNTGGLVGLQYGDINNSHTTSNVLSTTRNNSIGGLVGTQKNGDITNSYAMGNVKATGISSNHIGGLVGRLQSGTITNSYAMGNVKATGINSNHIGGLVGRLQSGTITNSYAMGNVKATGINSNHIGGLVGHLQSGTITNSYATGEVISRGPDSESIGGLVGNQASGKIVDSYATGKVSGRSYTGGLVGRQWHGATISNSYATGMVSGIEKNIGGLIGWQNDAITNSHAAGMVSSTGNNIGGLAGFQYGGLLTNSYATGKVSSTGNNIGGLVGKQWENISNSYATGEVSGTGASSNSIGGLVGQQYGDITNSYATGKVNGYSTIGGLVGHLQNGTITNSYATGMVSGIGNVAGGLVGVQGETLHGTITRTTFSSDTIRSYFDPTSTGQRQGIGKVVAGTGTPIEYTLNDLTGSDKFPGWDFTGMNSKFVIWHWIGTGKWPILQWQYEMQQPVGTTP
ncbi:hypothetical protein LSH36_1983g00003 [Paralvinella palmiformis]|uniref:GLUG domain-containing protein n=1 Tax=Paralvinella palmiformis TaxID=53620 RepID=A0AAD9MPP9_9ANNE|nr:hypothetical protein LSH36_1983g00003 [Paralvinella palmiformis]